MTAKVARAKGNIPPSIWTSSGQLVTVFGLVPSARGSVCPARTGGPEGSELRSSTGW